MYVNIYICIYIYAYTSNYIYCEAVALDVPRCFPLLVFTVGLLGEPPSEFSTRWFLAQVADLAKLGDIGDERLAPDRRDKRSLSVEEHVGPFWWFAVGGCSGNLLPS